MGNYNGVRGAGRSVFEHDHNDKNDPLIREEGVRIEELYYTKHQGDVQLTFTSHMRHHTWERSLENGGTMRIHRSVRLDEPDSHWVNIPIKATKKWDEFVESLPKWEESNDG